MLCGSREKQQNTRRLLKTTLLQSADTNPSNYESNQQDLNDKDFRIKDRTTATSIEKSQNTIMQSVSDLIKNWLIDLEKICATNSQKDVTEQIDEIVKQIVAIQYKEVESNESEYSSDVSCSSILRGLQTLEFALQENILGDAMVRYKGIPISQANTLEKLFSFKCSIVETEYAVTALDWHPLNSDVLAVGYTCNDLKEQNPKGMILIWTVRNPSYPEKVIKTNDGVCALAFSKDQSPVLAVGLESGCINLYDITLSNPLVIDTFSVPRRHISSVTQLQWVTDADHGASENLVSIGADGKVIQWSLNKGLHPQPLITLKRHNTKSNYHRLPDVAMGLSLDFLRANDSLTYICGAEDGTMFRCSRSYSEQHLYHMIAHNGPVTQIVASPLEDEFLISSGADSTIKLWTTPSKQNTIKHILTVSPLNLLAPINDVAWSPVAPTIFCFVTADGRVEIWDLSSSDSEPLHSKPATSPIMKGNEFTKLMFTTNGRAIVIGCDNGVVLSYSLPKNCYECNKNTHLIDLIKSWQ